LFEARERDPAIAFGCRHTQHPECELWCRKISARVEVRALSSATTSEGEVDCGLRGAVAVGRVPPSANQKRVVLEIEGDLASSWVPAERFEALAREVLDFVDFDHEVPFRKPEIEPGAHPCPL
jgi:hypothetical protein